MDTRKVLKYKLKKYSTSKKRRKVNFGGLEPQNKIGEVRGWGRRVFLYKNWG